MANTINYGANSFAAGFIRNQNIDAVRSAEDTKFAEGLAEWAKQDFLAIRLKEDGGLKKRGGPRKSNLPDDKQAEAAAAQHDQRLVVNRRSAGGKAVFLKVFEYGMHIRTVLKGKAKKLMEHKMVLGNKNQKIRDLRIKKRRSGDKLKHLVESARVYTQRVSVMEQEFFRIASPFHSFLEIYPLDIKVDFPVDAKDAAEVQEEEDQSDLDCEEEEEAGEDDDGQGGDVGAAKKSEESHAVNWTGNKSELDPIICSLDSRIPIDGMYVIDDELQFFKKEEEAPRKEDDEWLDTNKLSQEFEDENIPIRKPASIC